MEGRKSSNDYDFHTIQPLSQYILDQPIPSRFKIPQVDPYDGSTNLIDHLESYKALMMIQGATDALLCIGFPATLQKATCVWCSGLQSKNIYSFRQLEHSFAAHFSTSRRPPRTSDSLFSIKQGETETLWDFVACFNAATFEVKNLNENMAISAMKRGLRGSRFTYSLDKTLPWTYAELLECTYKYMRADEGASDRRQTKSKGQKKKQKKSGAPTESSRPPTNKRASPRRWNPKPTYNRYDSYIPPSAPRA